MTEFRIICTRQEPGTPHGHIVSVGTGSTSNQSPRSWTMDEVWAVMDLGYRFYTIGSQSGRKTYVEKYICCGRRTLRSAADAVSDNNLDSLPRCM